VFHSQLKQMKRVMFAMTVLAAASMGAPKLRLSTATAGPFSIAQGQNGNTQTVDAFNAGDGDLSLTVSSSATWLVPSVADTRSCGQPGGRCTAIRIDLKTAGLPRGTVTGFVTVSDPNAVDAPQTISVTAQVGGGVPESLQFFVPPNGSQVRKSFSTSTSFNTAASLGGGPRLTVLGSGGGSFRTVYSYDVVAVADEGTPEGDYNGSLVVSNSPLSADNRTVPVSVRVTSAGIAQASTESLRFRLSQGVAPLSKSVYINNVGIGGLTVTGANTSVTGDVNWLSASVDGATNVVVTASPEGLGNGVYSGVVGITSNAANDTINIAVTLEVVDAGPPLISYSGVVTTLGSEAGTLALGDLVTVLGEMLIAGSPEKVPDGTQWPTSLAGASVFLNDQPLPISYSAFDHIDLQIPYDIPEGEGLIHVERDGQRGNTVAVQIVRSRPRIFWVTTGDGTVISTAGGGPSAAVLAGSTVNFVGAGFGPPTSPVQAGTPAPTDPPATIDPFPLLRFGGSLFNPAPEITPSFAGLMPGTIGLYMITVTIPEDSNRGPNLPVSISGARDPIFLNLQ
jgi:uncharacterized protein (TIGR03437 family)